MPTVKQLLKEVLPPDTLILAGEFGIYGEVSWVVTLRPSPPGFDGLKGHEFAIVGSGVAEALGVSLHHLVSNLAERHISAIGLQGEVSDEACREAQARDVPLLKIPIQTNISSLESGVLRLISDERQLLYQKERDFSQSLMELAVAGGGSAAIMEKLKEMSGRSVGFVDLNLKPHFYLNPELAAAFSQGIQKVQGKLQNIYTLTPAPVIGITLAEGQACFVGPVRVGRELRGYLMLIAPENEMSEIDRLAIRAGSLALAVEMSRRQAVAETEARFEEDIIESLVSSNFSPQMVSEKAKKLKLDLSVPCAAIVLNQSPPFSALDSVVREAVSILPGASGYFHGQNLFLLYPLKSMAGVAELRQLGKKLSDGLVKNAGLKVTVGIGGSYSGPEGIRQAFQEAEQALTMGTEIFGTGSITSFRELGIHRLLFPLKSGGELKAYYNEYLGKLMEYERKRDGELGQTLKVFLQTNSIADTARELHVHRNTLLYRLERVREITGLDLADGEVRLALHLAFLAGEVLRTG
jgi:purine catabolism regulator